MCQRRHHFHSLMTKTKYFLRDFLRSYPERARYVSGFIHIKSIGFFFFPPQHIVELRKRCQVDRFHSCFRGEAGEPPLMKLRDHAQTSTLCSLGPSNATCPDHETPIRLSNWAAPVKYNSRFCYFVANFSPSDVFRNILWCAV